MLYAPERYFSAIYRFMYQNFTGLPKEDIEILEILESKCNPIGSWGKQARLTGRILRRIHSNPGDYGNNPGKSRPVFSARPNMIFIFWMACPAAPLPRLSMTERITTVLPDWGRWQAIRQ
uniref:Uncharacterized protein n=1 Tax=Candidatus Kentrum sp. FW TaxID=2126338 RepID=A0A450SDM9_9GAMM|nr:MAG: hypothetical protein BECKFW1821A_GA0114235_100849 [Candidatus Kentron sp. FW]VFJ50694.1 MAG: hypothetical protein BECKFW1821B_GA0114236_100743 [Candidatus Kentron sp. FW]